MRKTLALIIALAFGLTAAACGGHDEKPAARPSESVSAAVTPSAGTSADPADWTHDVTGLTWKSRPADVAPEGDQAWLSFTVTNHGQAPAYYTIVFAVYDKSGAQTTAIGVDTQNSGYGPTLPGHPLKVSGPWGTTDGAKVPVPFTVAVQSVDRIPVGK